MDSQQMQEWLNRMDDYGDFNDAFAPTLAYNPATKISPWKR
jgi:hypothetical protein